MPSSLSPRVSHGFPFPNTIIFPCVKFQQPWKRGTLGHITVWKPTRKYQESTSWHLLPNHNVTNYTHTKNCVFSLSMQRLMPCLWGEKGHSHIFRHYKTMFTGIYEVFPPRYSWGCPHLASWRSVFGQHSPKQCWQRCEFPTAIYQITHSWRNDCFFSPSRQKYTSATAHEMRNAHTLNESLNCSVPVSSTTMQAMQEKDDTSDWSGTHCNTVEEKYHLQYAPKFHQSYSCICVIYLLYITFYTPPKILLITPEKSYIIYFIRSL